MPNLNRIVFYFLIAIAAFESAKASACDAKSMVSGFSTVRVNKSYFYKDPLACANEKACKSRAKAFLIKGNFIQTGETQGKFICAKFRNFDGWSGKLSAGWLLLDDLTSVRRELERKDLIGSWTQIPCPAGDDCIIEIIENSDHTLALSIDSHIHDHPGSSFAVSNVVETPGKLIISGTDSGSQDQKKIGLTYGSNSSEPGTISLSGVGDYKGIYRK